MFQAQRVIQNTLLWNKHLLRISFISICAISICAQVQGICLKFKVALNILAHSSKKSVQEK